MLDFEGLYKNNDQNILVFSGFEEEALHSVECFDIAAGVWKEAGSLHIARTKFSAIETPDNRILLCGGKALGGASRDEVEEYNVENESSSFLPLRLREAKHGFGSCIFEGQLFLCGGNNGEILNKTERLDLLSMSWHSLPPLLERRDELAVVVGPDRCVYALGGFGGNRNATLRTVERFDVHTQDW